MADSLRWRRMETHVGTSVGGVNGMSDSIDYAGRLSEDRRRDRQPDRSRRLEIHGQINLSRLLDRKVRRLRTAQDLVDEVAGPAKIVDDVWRIGQQRRRGRRNTAAALTGIR